MRAILQRVSNASVKVADEVVGEIAKGVLVLLAVEHQDGPAERKALVEKMAGLRLFEDQDGKMNLDTAQAGGAFLVVSQFTLAASLRRGRRPSFDGSAKPEKAEPMVEAVMADLRNKGFEVAGGRFGAHMEVALTNDGPVTFVLDVREGKVA